ncbi:MAG TPA: hypothetical protein VK395_05225 [Gemmataceae bacterium]|nr:hypothetical protein [Gemmataceae bacterium]
MRRCFSLTLALLVVAILSSQVQAAGDELKSGPQPGEEIPGPFHILNINGEHAANLHCLVCAYGLRPVVAVFTREPIAANKTLATLLQKLDEDLVKYKDARLRAFAVLLSDEFPKEEGRKNLVAGLGNTAAELDLKRLILAAGDSAGPDNYKLNKDAALTVVLYRNHKVIANFAFAKDKFTENDITAILEGVHKMIGAKK